MQVVKSKCVTINLFFFHNQILIFKKKTFYKFELGTGQEQRGYSISNE